VQLIATQTQATGDNAAMIAEQTQAIKAMTECDSSKNAPVVVYVSKMFGMNPSELPTVRKARMTPEELKLLRENIVAKSRAAETGSRYKTLTQWDRLHYR
jgi:translation elongation factor EF-G